MSLFTGLNIHANNLSPNQVIKAMIKKDGSKMSAAIKMLKGNTGTHWDTANMVQCRELFDWFNYIWYHFIDPQMQFDCRLE